MKQLFLAFFIMISHCQGMQSDDVQDIYADIITADFKNNIIVVEDSTSIGYNSKHYTFKRFAEECENLLEETFDDFMVVNKDAGKLDLNIQTKKKIIYISQT